MRCHSQGVALRHHPQGMALRHHSQGVALRHHSQGMALRHYFAVYTFPNVENPAQNGTIFPLSGS